MGKVLLVSHGEKNKGIFAGLLGDAGFDEIITVTGSRQARQCLNGNEFALVVIVTPLPEEYGCEVAKAAAQTTAGVILVVKSEHETEMARKMEPEGVFVFTPGMGKKLFMQAARLQQVLHRRLAKAVPQQAKLEQKLEDIRLIDRAKCLLIQYEGITETQAHHHIEREAMNRRITRREMAEIILQNYDI